MTPARRSHLLAAVLVVALGLAGSARSQPRTMGSLLNAPEAYDGYTLFEALSYPETFLIDNRGRRVHSWVHAYNVAAMSYLLENGHLMRLSDPDDNDVFLAGGAGGLIQDLDWSGDLLWEFHYSSAQYRLHHDMAVRPNGNVLAIAWEYKTVEEAIAAGRDPAFLSGELWPDHVIEVEPFGRGGTIVWEWHAWDHLIQDFDATKDNFGVIAEHPELIDINFPLTASPDWLHCNAIDYNEQFDQIAISSPRFGEVWVIDHGTTTEEAAGHAGGARGMGGDLLYRWGNPESYGRGTANDKKLFFQHDTHWIRSGLPGEGNILIFNNGTGRPDGAYASVEEIVTPVEADGDYPVPPPGMPHGPPEAIWTYTATPPESLVAPFVSGAQRQPNGNTLICAGPSGKLLEIDESEEAVWVYVNPVNSQGPLMQGDPPSGNATFRGIRYPPNYSGFSFKDLTPGAPIELYPTTSVPSVRLDAGRVALAQNYPNPVRPGTTFAFSLHEPANVTLDVYDIAGRHVANVVSQHLEVGEHRYEWWAGRLTSGIYCYTLRAGSETETRRMTIVR